MARRPWSGDRVQHDRPGLGDGYRGAGDHAVARRPAPPAVSTSSAAIGIRTSASAAVGTPGQAGRARRSAARRGGQRRGDAAASPAAVARRRGLVVGQPLGEQVQQVGAVRSPRGAVRPAPARRVQRPDPAAGPGRPAVPGRPRRRPAGSGPAPRRGRSCRVRAAGVTPACPALPGPALAGLALAHHSRNVSEAGTRRVPGGRPRRQRRRQPADPAAAAEHAPSRGGALRGRYSGPLAMTQDAAAIAIASGPGTRCSRRAASTCRARRWTRIDGMSIFTGQTS